MSGIKLPMRVWDLPIRLFHWALVVCVVLSYVSMKIGWVEVHLASGYTVLALLLFRLVWGLIGSDTARFTKFIKGSGAVIAHLRSFTKREPDNVIGHNPAGGWMVMLLLLLLCVQVGSGLFALDADDYPSYAGSLAHFISREGGLWAATLHGWAVNFLLAVVVVHILAIGAYAQFKGQNLLRPMLNGKKRLPGAMRAPRMVSPTLAAIIFIVAALTAFWISRL